MLGLAFRIVLLVTSALAGAQTALSPALVQKLDAIADKDVPADAPGVACAIIRDGKTVYQRCSGFADLSTKTAITPDSRFNIASNGKQFTALAVLLLIHEGKLSLDDDVHTYLPGLLPSVSDRITIRHLLTHSSGLRDCYDLWSLMGYTWWEHTFSNSDVLALMKRQNALNFTPGSQYRYSNTNYILLAMVVEAASGLSFRAYTDRMFQTLGMPGTSFESDYTAIRGPIARAYFNFGEWTTYDWKWNVCGDGNLFTTLRDQIRWEEILQGKKVTGLPREVLAESQRPVVGATIPNYGYGLEFDSYKGRPYRFHEGATGAWKSTVLRFPDQNISLLTLTNTGKSVPSTQTREMADAFFGIAPDAIGWKTTPETTGDYVEVASVLGMYLTESDFFFRFIEKQGVLFLVRAGRNDVELEREGPNLFHQKYDPAFKQEFTKGNDGIMTVTAYYTDHAPYSLKKVEGDFSGFRDSAPNGHFVNSETDAEFYIALVDGHSYKITIGENEMEGILVAPDKMVVGSYSLRTADGWRSILVNGDRIQSIAFDRK